jgi:glucose/arabinose dehydrogenase
MLSMIYNTTLAVRYWLLLLVVGLFFEVFVYRWSGYAQQQTAVGYARAFAQNLTFDAPLEMLPSNDGTGRIFIVSQNGIIWTVQNSTTASAAQQFLNIGATGANRIVFAGNEERGLLGMALHPNFRQNGQFFLYYTTTVSPSNPTTRMVLARYRVSPQNPNQALVESEERLLSFDKNQPNTNHNGGKIAFGTDGLLYLSIGDGGGGGDPQNNAQTLTNLFGKMLRIDVNGDDFPDDPLRNYRIPPDNPFARGGGRPEIFAWGLRNTWKFCFDALGRVWGADVGQGAWEEINIITRGANYGWRRFEGNAVRSAADPVPMNPSATFPVFVYSSIGGASITGGYVYRGTQIPSLRGKYVYADFVRGTVSALTITGAEPSASTVVNERLFTAIDGTTVVNIASFGEDDQGELYFLGRNTNRVYRLTNTAPPQVGRTINGIGSWSALVNGVNGTIQALAADSLGNLYVGGTFTMAGNVPALNIARWNAATGWSALGGGIAGAVQAIAVRGSLPGNATEVFAGGFFSNASGMAASNLARWDGTRWSAIGGGTDGPVRALAVGATGLLFVGGSFSRAGSVANSVQANNIAQWDGTTWSALGTGTAVGTNNEIRALAVDNATRSVVVGGNFSSAGGVGALCVARWDGARWNSLGTGTNGFVNSLAVTPRGDIVAGGSFTMAGGMAANRIAQWNGSAWSSVGTGVSGTVNALLPLPQGDVLAGGTFVLAGGAIVNNVALWNESTGWNALGMVSQAGIPVGTTGGVNALVFPQPQTSAAAMTVVVGGGFSAASGVAASNIARLQVPATITSLQQAHNPHSSRDVPFGMLTLAPNPTSSVARIEFVLATAERVHISLVDMLGRERVIVTNDLRPAGKNTLWLPVHDIATGLYWCRLQTQSASRSILLIIQ